ncbi:Cilia/flagella-associated protein 20/WDR90/C3orf67 [Cokeromyces recurvatus]|uniref:Cilia/flagella-associated protein 20/WDR90/C3orf67 n=1 Tax=Cokeromyces recurvatus TaxID=90255 RepID=UPI002220DB81|nr:Cilia/flagella-associated protein 20/WDR90/C3orf67 [Cokeromyces recurvatus]KAI7900901.1 Cilia/flagella-associated protein 20/WDR90/C3orf67 [Cokeromyces recurvatus]
MFRNTFQSGFLSILYSLGNEPLQLWSCHLPTEDSSNNESAHIERVADDLISSTVIELTSSNLSNTFISCPRNPTLTLGIKLPYLIFIIKNLDKYFSFEVEVLDDKNETRRFRASNYQMTTRVKPYITTMPMRLDPGWNQIIFNMSDYVKKGYGTNYSETSRVTVHANCRIRRIYFTDRVYSEDELPAEFKLFLPIDKN